jgi:hypothetical protein
MFYEAELPGLRERTGVILVGSHRCGARRAPNSPNKGGHRERGVALIDQAIGEVRAGFAFAGGRGTRRSAQETDESAPAAEFLNAGSGLIQNQFDREIASGQRRLEQLSHQTKAFKFLRVALMTRFPD